MNALQSCKRVNWPACLRSRHISFDNFVARDVARVFYAHCCGKRPTSLQMGWQEPCRSVLEVRVAQAVAKAPERFALVIAISALLHRVLGKCRKVANTRVKRD